MTTDIDLKGRQFEELHEALLHAFPGYGELEMMLMFKLGESLPNISPPVNPLTKVAYDLIVWAKAKGRLSDLLAGALEENATNPHLRRVALGVAVTSTAPPTGRLEARVLQGIPFPGAPGAGVTLWRQKMEEAERCVCRVEIPEGVSRGTGFLVGPDVVLTNWHVAQLVDEKGVRPDEAAVRFDYKLDASRQPAAGQPVALAADWLLASSPALELDYALVRLAERAGEGRGKLTPRPYDFPPHHPLFILQHPRGEPLDVQVGSILSVNGLHKRVNYTTNTAGGSSGSPCFTTSWEAVALHHYGQQTSNMGIPLKDISEHVRRTQPAVAGELGW